MFSKKDVSAIVKCLIKEENKKLLLVGVTGTGKTVCIKLAKDVLDTDNTLIIEEKNTSYPMYVKADVIFYEDLKRIDINKYDTFVLDEIYAYQAQYQLIHKILDIKSNKVILLAQTMQDVKQLNLQASLICSENGLSLYDITESLL